jgi:hypothetical protein
MRLDVKGKLLAQAGIVNGAPAMASREQWYASFCAA